MKMVQNSITSDLVWILICKYQGNAILDSYSCICTCLDVTRKKTGTHFYFQPFFKMAVLKSEISIISEITSWRVMIWGSKPIFSWSRNQINTLYGMGDHYFVCKRTKNMKNSKMATNFMGGGGTPVSSRTISIFGVHHWKHWYGS